MLDPFVRLMKSGLLRVQQRGETMSAAARLRVQLFQLTRERDQHYAELGRAYHKGASVAELQGIREQIRQTEVAREALERCLQELGES